MPAIWFLLEQVGVAPGYGHGHHAKLEVIGDGESVAGLGALAANLLFEFLEGGFDLPPCGIELDDLFDGEVQIGGEEGQPLGAAVNPDDPYLALDGFEHGYGGVGLDGSRFSVGIDRIRFGLLTMDGGLLGSRTERFAVGARAAQFAGSMRKRRIEQGGIGSQP